MAISFTSALGVHEDALLIRERRAEVLATNLANADTPGFRARDLDFKALVQEAIARPAGAQLQTTRARHIGGTGAGTVEGALLYRVPMQPSLDGNTVDTDLEMASFARNSLDFQASLTFLQSKFRGLKSALRGD